MDQARELAARGIDRAHQIVRLANVHCEDFVSPVDPLYSSIPAIG